MPVGKVSVAASLAMLAWMGRSIVTGQIPFTGDLLHFHYPLRDFYAGALAAGQRFDWIPGLFNGFYLVGEGQLGGYHPLHWLLYRALPLDRAFAVELVVAYPFLFSGTWLWLRRRCGAGAAAFGAMAVTFCGFTLVHGVHLNMLGVLAHVPWLLWAIDGAAARAGDRLDRRGAALIGLLLGSQLLLGHPQSVWFSGLICAAYGWHVMTAARSVSWSLAATIVVGAGLGLAVGGVQVLATMDAVSHSTRPDSADFSTQYSLRPVELLLFLHSYLLWGRVSRWNETAPAGDDYGVYGGAVVFVLAVWWIARQWRQADRFSIHLAVLAVLALWLATGSYGKLYYLQTWLPLVGQFRAPVRYALFAQWAVAVLAALALAQLARGKPDDERGPLTAVWAVVALAAVSAFSMQERGASQLATWWGPLVLTLGATLLTLALRGMRSALIALVLLAAADQAVYGLNGVIAWQDFVTRQQAIGFLDTNSFLPRAGEGRLLRGNFPNLYLLARHRLVDGYVALSPSRQLDSHQSNALRVAQVDYVHADFFAGAPAPSGALPADHGWFHVPGPLPRVRLLTEARVSGAPSKDIEGVDVARTALVTHQLPLGGGTAGAARLLADDPGDVMVEVDAPSAQLLVLSESFHDGWRVSIDDEPAPVERVNGDFLGVVAPPGPHDVRFRFRPLHLTAGRWVSIGGLAVALLLLWRSRRTID